MTHHIFGTSAGRKPVKERSTQATALVVLLLSVSVWIEATTGADQFHQQTSKSAPTQMTINDPPEARSPFVLKAIDDRKTGLSALEYEGSAAPPVIRARPGNDILITYRNRMDEQRREPCLVGPCMNMTNLHFHGLHVSPQKGQDDVITMAALPGETLHYRVVVPKDQPPGLYWYHTHPHGESYQQALDGMSGALVISGIERYAPEVLRMRERIIVLRDKVVEEKDPDAPHLRKQVIAPVNACGQASGMPQRIFSVNGAIRPSIPIRSGVKQFWRIVNASPDLYADLAIPGQSLKVIALDGMPLAVHNPQESACWMQHVLVPPASRVEAIVTGPSKGVRAMLKSRCFDTGKDGDPNPELVLADLVDRDDSSADSHIMKKEEAEFAPVKQLEATAFSILKANPPTFTARFTGDKNGFYINGSKYHPEDGPMTTATVGSFVHWRVVNDTSEVHPFHIHQVHFLTYAENGHPIDNPIWLDTVNVPVGASLDLMMDFTDPIIRGLSVFHCHLLKHEDKGMMAKILFQ